MAGSTTLTLRLTDAGVEVCRDTVRVTVIGLNVAWETLSANPVVIADDNNHPSGTLGVKYFPGATTPGGGWNDLLGLRITTDPPVQGLQVFLKAFDPDDPSANNDVVDNNLTGGDNRDDNHHDTAELGVTQITTGGTGQALTSFRVAHQPGDNHRVAATIKPMAQGVPTLDMLNDNNVPPSNTHNPPTQDQVELFIGDISDLLTVWRKLHVEVDSMGAVDWTATATDTGNAQAGTVQAAPTFNAQNSHAFIDIANLHDDFHEDDQHQVGRIDITGFGSFTTVATQISFGDDVIEIINAPPTIVNANGASYTLWDDDAGSVPPFVMVAFDAPPVTLPKVPDTTLMAQVYKTAYVDVPPPNMQFFQGTTVFDRNVADGESANKAKENLDFTSAADYWAVHITSAFQGWVDKDNDPDSEQAAPQGLQYGVTKPTGLLGGRRAGSLVYLETIRDDKRKSGGHDRTGTLHGNPRVWVPIPVGARGRAVSRSKRHESVR